jgi:hypothetical protein
MGKAAAIRPPFEVGSCIAIELEDGSFAAGIITRKEWGSAPFNILSVLDYHAAEAPSAEFFRKFQWLMVPREPGWMLKYNLYTNGWLKARQYYSFVDTLSLEGVTVPEPVMMLGNWGNMRADLAKQLAKFKNSPQ